MHHLVADTRLKDRFHRIAQDIFQSMGAKSAQEDPEKHHDGSGTYPECGHAGQTPWPCLRAPPCRPKCRTPRFFVPGFLARASRLWSVSFFLCSLINHFGFLLPILNSL